jgi:hypothetical protein
MQFPPFGAQSKSETFMPNTTSTVYQAAVSHVRIFAARMAVVEFAQSTQKQIAHFSLL